jgi:hypothetical protein
MTGPSKGMCGKACRMEAAAGQRAVTIHARIELVRKKKCKNLKDAAAIVNASESLPWGPIQVV